MPSKSPKQRRFMAAVANNPKFAKKVGVPQSVGREFYEADKAQRKSKGGPVTRGRRKGYNPDHVVYSTLIDPPEVVRRYPANRRARVVLGDSVLTDLMESWDDEPIPVAQKAKGGKVSQPVRRLSEWLSKVFPDGDRSAVGDNSPEYYDMLKQLDWDPLIPSADADMLITQGIFGIKSYSPSDLGRLDELIQKYGTEMPPGHQLWRGERSLGVDDSKITRQKAPLHTSLSPEVADQYANAPFLAAAPADRLRHIVDELSEYMDPDTLIDYPVIYKAASPQGARVFPQVFNTDDEFMFTSDYVIDPIEWDTVLDEFYTTIIPANIVRRSKGGKVEALKDAWDHIDKRVRQRMPHQNFFSTLHELIKGAPMEQMPPDQWANYLKPGRMLKREGLEFPLKKEELKYVGIEDILREAMEKGQTPLTKLDLADAASKRRPVFVPRTEGEDNFLPYSHANPTYGGNEDVGYWERITGMPGLGYDTHFGTEALSWSRGTTTPTPRGGQMRLIDEIQSDLHSDAADWGLRLPNGRWRPARVLQNAGLTDPPALERRGYRTPEQEARFQVLDTWDPDALYEDHLMEEYLTLKETPPDAPFKNTADYGALEIKKNLLEAVDDDMGYLGITNAEDAMGWFGHGDAQRAGMEHAYDVVYPNELEKLARKYGAPFGPVATNLSAAQVLPKALHFPTGDLDLPDFITSLRATAEHNGPEYVHGNMLTTLRNLRDTWETTLRESGDLDEMTRTLAQYDDLLDDIKNIKAGDVDVHIPQILDDLRHVIEEGTRHLGMKRLRGGNADSAARHFPAMTLTPEVKEKIKRIGLPLWMLTGAGIGLDALSEDNDEIH